MQLIDTHAHIYAEEFEPDRAEMIERAKLAGLEHILMPNIDQQSIGPMYALADQFPGFCLPMMGLHPCSVTAAFDKQLHEIEKHLSDRRFVAIGEIGIDLYWDKSTFEYQKHAFNTQCEWALDMNLPVVIHSRDSTSEIIGLLKKMPRIPRGVFHCFGGSLEESREIVDLGMYLGIGGVLTFKNSALSTILKEIDITRLLLETDAPYLAPVPHRGKRNEPSYLLFVIEKMSEVFRLSSDELGEITSQNARALFEIGQ